MRGSTKTLPLFATAALAIGFAGSASAQDNPSVVVIEQVQLDNVWSQMNVDVPDYTWEATATSTAVGNAAAGLVTTGSIDLDTFQTLEGDVLAESSLIGGTAGTAVATTTAYGNSTTGGTWDGNTFYRTEQTSNGDVEARTDVDMTDADTIATATTAIANVSVPTNEYGDHSAFQIQESNGSVTSTTTVDMENPNVCCEDSASFATTAGGNALSSTGWSSTSINGAVQTTASGETIRASTTVEMEDGNNVLAATTSFGNSATLHNEWGYASLGREGSELFQGNDSEIVSDTSVTLNDWSGYATSSAYGVGNAATVSNVGSDTGLYAIQNNYGDVTTTAGLNGTSTYGGDGVVTSTAIGNAATATLCNICGDAALQGRTQQFNAGNVTAQGTATIGASGSVFGAATAVGNSATYQSNGQ